MNETVKAKSYWVWTDKAEELNPNHSKAGDPIWYQHKYKAPVKWLEDGLIIDNTEYIREGQASIFDYL